MKTAEQMLKDKYWNGKYIEIHSGDWSDIADIMQEYAEQFIDLAAETAITKGRFNKNLVEKEKQILKEQLK